jgi:Tfp pilus assembly protein PilN
VRILNLASRPSRNERLPNLLVALLAVFVLALTAQHVLVVRRLRPGRTLGPQVAALEQESRNLRAEGEHLRGARVDPAAAAHWSILKDLVDRKMFSWTSLFSVLEDALPLSIRLVSIAPSVQRGEVVLGLDAVARSKDDGLDFIRILEERDEFYDVVPVSRGGEGGTSFHYTMKYKAVPPAPVSPVTPAATGAPAAGEPGRPATPDAGKAAP